LSSGQNKFGFGSSRPEEEGRVARFFLGQDTKIGKNAPNEHKVYQMVINKISKMAAKYSKWP
jgi:hypothetical protein